MYALDANTVIYYFKGKGRVAERLLACAPSEVALPSVVLYELEVGVNKSLHGKKRREQLDMLLRHVRILPFGASEARVTAELRAELEQTGLGIGPLDTLIAGTALAHGAILVTRNVYEFSRVHGLRYENWYVDEPF